jgi:hypothetical protein
VGHPAGAVDLRLAGRGDPGEDTLQEMPSSQRDWPKLPHASAAGQSIIMHDLSGLSQSPPVAGPEPDVLFPAQSHALESVGPAPPTAHARAQD